MKTIKVLALVVLSILFVVFAALLQAEITLGSTALSPGYFNSVFDRSFTPKSIEALAKSADAGSGAAGSSVLGSLFANAAGEKWLQTELPKLAKGSFAYFVTGGNSLPVVDIKPLKDALVNAYASQALSASGQGADAFMQMIAGIEKSSGALVKDGKANGKAVDAFVSQINAAAGVTVKRDTAERIIIKAGNRKKDGTGNDALFSYAVTEMSKDQLGISKMKDSLDLNVLVEKAYGAADNPVSGFSAMFSGTRSNLFLLNLAVVLLLLAAIVVVAFHPSGILRWTGATLIVAGAFCLIPPAMVLIFNGAIRLQIVQLLGPDAQHGLSFIRDWMLSYIDGAALFMFVQSVVVIAAGAAFLFCAKHFDGKGRHASRASGGGPSYAAVRIVAALVLIAAIPVAAYVFGRGIASSVEKYDAILKAADKAQGGPDFSRALNETLGMDVFGGVGQ